MTVKELIEKLEKVENKNLQICAGDWDITGVQEMHWSREESDGTVHEHWRCEVLILYQGSDSFRTL